MSNSTAQEWFEMADLRRRKFSNAIWIPLRAAETTKISDSAEEFFGAGSVAFPPDKRAQAEKLGWSDIGIMHEASPYAFKDKPYKPVDTYQYNDGEDMGVNLIFVQHLGNNHDRVWHINPDLIIALGLIQEGDIWTRPEESYVDVIRQRRAADGRVVAVEIRSEFLRDYLAARRLALRISYYRQRQAKMKDASHISWRDTGIEDDKEHDRYCARVYEADEDGGPFGGQVALFHYWRTDVDPSEDVPVFGPETDQNVAGQHAVYTREGPKTYNVEGELWREEWIEPSPSSERVRGDPPSETFSYIIEASGQRESSINLNDEDIGRYLWFNPRVIAEVLGRRGADMKWHTKQTGTIWSARDWGIHFGINQLGIINVYAYDIAKLPSWQQRIWNGQNVTPNGPVSTELLSAQMQARPARTKAPEALIPLALDDLDSAIEARFGKRLFLDHEATDQLLKAVSRFRALDANGIFTLAKDLSRLIVERISIEVLRAAVQPPAGEKWGTLKYLEKTCATLVPADNARTLLTPLVGLYALRLGDAHLPSAKLEDAFELLGLESSLNPIDQGTRLIEIVVESLNRISDTFR